MTARITAWITIAGVIGVAAWTARWSPTLQDAYLAGPRRGTMDISVFGALQVAFVHMATGAGVLMTSVLNALGPGRDITDGRAADHAANGTPATRVSGRVAVLVLIGSGCGCILAIALVGVAVLTAVHNDFAVQVVLGAPRWGMLAAAAGISATQVIIVLAVVGTVRAQAMQLVAPMVTVLVMFMVSRLSPLPITPDSWIGPLLDLKQQRSLLDFWWSVGGSVERPVLNACLWVTLAGLAFVRLLLVERGRSNVR